MSANERYENFRLGTGQSFDRVFLVREPTDANGDATDPIFDDELLTKAAAGTSVSDRPFAIAGLPRVTWSQGTNHTVVIPYRAPSTLTPGFGGEWQMRISAYPDSVRMDVTRPTEQEKAEGIDPIIVGPYQYKRMDSTTTSPAPSGEPWEEYWADNLELILDPATKAKRDVYGMDVLTPNAQITYTRRFIDDRPGRIMELFGRHCAVNEDEVSLPKLGGRVFFPRQLILWSFEVNEAIGTDTHNPVVHDASVTFAVKTEGWQFDFYHTYTDTEAAKVSKTIVKIRGNQTPVPNGTEPAPEHTPVGERFRRQYEVWFNGWLESLR